MSTSRPLLLLVLLGSALVWAAAGELQWPARLLTTALLVPVPAALVMQARLVGDPASLPRLAVYASSAVSLIVLATATVAAAKTGGFSLHALGLALPGGWGTQLAWAVGCTAVAITITWVGHLLGLRETQLLFHLLPRTISERAAFLGLSVTAGFCEELVFRGFLITAIHAASGSLVLALLMSSLAFGVVHAYQEPGGIARATLLGLVLAAPLVITGSLAGAMLAHTAIDIIGGWWLGPRLLRSAD